MSSVNSAAPLGQLLGLARSSQELNHPGNLLGRFLHHTQRRGLNPNEFKALLLLSNGCFLDVRARVAQILSALATQKLFTMAKTV